ncbi:MAG: hypothetical protein R2681_10780 [Pyrinomonadaceae bacterium]
MKNFTNFCTAVLMLVVLVPYVFAQRKTPAAKKPVKDTIFAVVNDGKQIEPIAYIEQGTLKEIGSPDDASSAGSDFVKSHYKPKSKYKVVFGGRYVGVATVTKDLSDTECASNQAVVSILPRNLKFKGVLMALATSATPKKSVKGVRKRPTIAERREIETNVMMLMAAKKVPVKNIGELRYHNLTKIDVDDDGNDEFVGSYWYNTAADKRSLMFFIAQKDSAGTLTLPYTSFEEYDKSNVMSGEIESLDSGVYHELLIDVFDVDADGTGEIFTMTQGFEGSNFAVYKRSNGGWSKLFDTSNYHCGY